MELNIESKLLFEVNKNNDFTQKLLPDIIKRQNEIKKGSFFSSLPCFHKKTRTYNVIYKLII